jgi:peptidyl-prolyl cis-trans isomerase B (cyclophilin B)
MIFQIYSDLSPNSAAAIGTLVNSGFYTNLTFHRVARAPQTNVPFVIQGGDPKGDGSGGPGFNYNLETTPLSLFTGDGQLSLAHTSDVNTNGSQFFVTFGNQQSALDGKFTLLGQLVRGFNIRDDIMNLNPTGDGPPSQKVTILSASMVPDYTDTVLLVQAPAGYNADPLIVLTGTTAGGTSTQTFHVQVGNGGVDLQRIQFVNRAFSTMLNRPAEPAALNYFTGLLANNQATTNQIALMVQTSFESRITTVQSIYKTLLNRPPEQQALTNGVVYLMQGGSEAHLEAIITASQEYFEAKGGTNAKWVVALFKDATGATSVPQNYVSQVSAMLDQGMSRTNYADTIFNSLSANVFLVQSLFKQFLERTPSVADATPFAQVLTSGTSVDLVVMTIVGSNEFFQFTKNQNAGSGA